MKKIFFGTLFLALVIAVPIPTMAMGGRVDVGVSIPLPPLIVFSAPPEVVVIPETYVYAVPDLDVDFFFYNGWWWRPWEGRWYRSRNYSSGWSYYQDDPSFYRGIPSGWRNDYREHRWSGHQWDYQRIPHQQLQKNWNNWEKNKYWEKQNTWGVKDLKSRTRSQQPSQAVQQQQSQQRDQGATQESRPQSRGVQQQQSQPQDQKATKKSKNRNGKSEKGEQEKEDR